MYVRDFDEDPEDLFIFYNNIDKERIKKNTSALQDLQGDTRIHNSKPERGRRRLAVVFRVLQICSCMMGGIYTNGH